MAATTVAAASSMAYLRNVDHPVFSSKLRFGHIFPTAKHAPRFLATTTQKKVSKYDKNWSNQWFGAGLFYEGSEQVEVDVFKKLEKQKVLSNVKKAGLLSKAEELAVTLLSIEKLGLLSKAEDLGLLSVVETFAGASPAALASAALPAFTLSIYCCCSITGCRCSIS